MRIRIAAAVVLAAATSLLTGESAAHAQATVQRNIPFDQRIFGCTEWIDLSGTLQVLETATFMPSGGAVFTFSVSPRGVRGTGETTGERYIGTGLTRSTFTIAPSGTVTETDIDQFHIVGTAGAATYDVRAVLHFTVNPRGAFTADVEKFYFNC